MVTTTPDITTGKKKVALKNPLRKIFSFRKYASANEIMICNGIWTIRKVTVFTMDFQNSLSSKSLIKLSNPTYCMSDIIFHLWNVNTIEKNTGNVINRIK
jgi:hypothetical protein